jgi:hypothetical protein
MTTYTAFNIHNSDEFESGLSARDAADRILSYDSQEWEIRPLSDGGYVLWTRKQVASIAWTEQHMIWSLADTLDAATDEICRKVLTAEPGRNDGIEVMTDAAFARMRAEFEADAE